MVSKQLIQQKRDQNESRDAHKDAAPSQVLADVNCKVDCQAYYLQQNVDARNPQGSVKHASGYLHNLHGDCPQFFAAGLAANPFQPKLLTLPDPPLLL